LSVEELEEAGQDAFFSTVHPFGKEVSFPASHQSRKEVTFPAIYQLFGKEVTSYLTRKWYQNLPILLQNTSVISTNLYSIVNMTTCPSRKAPSSLLSATGVPPQVDAEDNATSPGTKATLAPTGNTDAPGWGASPSFDNFKSDGDMG